MKRTKAEMLRIARVRLDGCRAVVKAGQKMRPHLEAIRTQYAYEGDLPGLAACANFSDRVAFWEGYGRNATRFQRLIDRLRGAP